MPKSEVYSWRLSPEMKAALEREAARREISLAELLEHVAQEWLVERARTLVAEEEEAQRIRVAAMATFGTVSSGESDRSTRVRELVRKRLATRRDP